VEPSSAAAEKFLSCPEKREAGQDINEMLLPARFFQ
jgi:hypothetical protein